MDEITYPDGARLAPWPYRSEQEIASLKRAFLACRQTDDEAERSARDGWPDRCPHCRVAPGEAHGSGCDWEQCPRCGGQLIACGCHRPGSER